VYFTDRGIEELESRLAGESVSIEWLARGEDAEDA
jgi:hypothetical protein